MKIVKKNEIRVGTYSNRFNVVKSYDVPVNEVHIRVLDPETMKTMDSIVVKILDMGIL